MEYINKNNNKKMIYMKNKKYSNILIAAKPNIFMAFGFAVIVVVGVLGEIFSWLVLFHGLARTIIGIAVFILGWVLHLYCHKFHKKAHEATDQIQNVITAGPFSTIRHPMYLSLILMYFGLAVGWGIIWMLIPAVVFSVLVIITALKEEEYLSQKLGSQYQEYIKNVPWRFIPNVF